MNYHSTVKQETLINKRYHPDTTSIEEQKKNGGRKKKKKNIISQQLNLKGEIIS